MKDSYYFPHDYHARHDERMLFIKSKYGMEGHGIYWILIEMMHEQDDGKLTCNLIEGIAKEYNIDITLLKQFYADAINTGLFQTDNNKYWSARVIKNKRTLELKRKRRSIAGKRGMAIRWGKGKCDNNVITLPNKESKVKESKVLYGKHNLVLLTKEEHTKLLAELGAELTNQFIERLDLYVGSKGAKYKSHYFTILNWARKEQGCKTPQTTPMRKL